MFSQRLETSSANLAVAETILVDTCVKAVNTLEAMLPFQDAIYEKDIKTLGATPTGLKEINNWCMKKFALLMFLMKRKRLLLEEVEDEIEEGAPEDVVDFGGAKDGAVE
jgi:hypothetical protein